MMMIILEQAFLYFPLMLGAYLSISLMKMPDLSIESAYVFGAILATKGLVLHNSLPLELFFILQVLIAALGGLLVGLVSSFFTQFARIPHLLSSILTIGLFHGINQFVLGRANMSLSGYNNPLLLFPFLPKNPEILLLGFFFLLLLIGSWFLLKTQLGFSLAVFGNNKNFFEHYGISESFVCCSGIMLANALAGISGYFVAQSSGFVDVSAGFGVALFCVTTLILGKTFYFFKRPFSISIPAQGIIIYCIIQQLLLKAGFNLKYFTMIQSAIVLIMLVNKYRNADSITSSSDNLGV